LPHFLLALLLLIVVIVLKDCPDNQESEALLRVSSIAKIYGSLYTITYIGYMWPLKGAMT